MGCLDGECDRVDAHCRVVDIRSIRSLAAALYGRDRTSVPKGGSWWANRLSGSPERLRVSAPPWLEPFPTPMPGLSTSRGAGIRSSRPSRLILAIPASWDRIIDHVSSELASFRGDRALFVNNAYYSVGVGFAGTIDPDVQRRQVFANAAAPLVLGDAFIRACDPRFESGLVMISSAIGAAAPWRPTRSTARPRRPWSNGSGRSGPNDAGWRRGRG